MWIYNFNNWTQQYYKYPKDQCDMNHVMFDQSLHNNDLTPMTLHKTKCMYCHTDFPTRKELFHHLGFMNIDIRKPEKVDEYKMKKPTFVGSFTWKKYLGVRKNWIRKKNKKVYSINSITNGLKECGL